MGQLKNQVAPQDEAFMVNERRYVWIRAHLKFLVFINLFTQNSEPGTLWKPIYHHKDFQVSNQGVHKLPQRVSEFSQRMVESIVLGRDKLGNVSQTQFCLNNKLPNISYSLSTNENYKPATNIINFRSEGNFHCFKSLCVVFAEKRSAIEIVVVENEPLVCAMRLIMRLRCKCVHSFV